MDTTVLNPPLSNLQVEMLKLFATDIPEENLEEVKILVAKYLLENARDKADEVWQAKSYTDESFEKLLNE
ncbi:MAG: hypothetical protein LH478_10390 [Chitinophagaceae bacterium]|nr:hypothetical protein [Chitinophagaceae bacterium]